MSIASSSRALVVCALLAGGCGPPTANTAESTAADPTVAIGDEQTTAVDPMLHRTLEHEGIDREYFVYLPEAQASGEPLPVLIALHGYTGSATGLEAAATGGLNRHAERRGYIAVYPQGTHFVGETEARGEVFVSSWNTIAGQADVGPEGAMCTEDHYEVPCPPECNGSCGDCGWVSCYDDVGFVDKLIDAIVTDYSADADRIYITGFSNGGMMAYRLACELSERFAAAADIHGLTELGFTCSPGSDLPLLLMAGGKDTTVPPDGSDVAGWLYSRPEVISEVWAAGLSCSAGPAPWIHPIAEEQGLQCTAYTGCGSAGDREVVSCIDPEATHRWPGRASAPSDTPRQPGPCVRLEQSASLPDHAICVDSWSSEAEWGSDLIWDFLSRYSR